MFLTGYVLIKMSNLIPFMFLTAYVLIFLTFIPFMFLKIYVLIKNECNLVFLLFCPSRACVFYTLFLRNQVLIKEISVI